MSEKVSEDDSDPPVLKTLLSCVVRRLELMRDDWVVLEYPRVLSGTMIERLKKIWYEETKTHAIVLDGGMRIAAILGKAKLSDDTEAP